MGESKICGEMIASRSINCMEEAYVPLVLYEDRGPTFKSVGVEEGSDLGNALHCSRDGLRIV